MKPPAPQTTTVFSVSTEPWKIGSALIRSVGASDRRSVRGPDVPFADRWPFVLEDERSVIAKKVDVGTSEKSSGSRVCIRKWFFRRHGGFSSL